MITSTHDCLKLIGYSTCEIIIQIVGALIFSILLCLKVRLLHIFIYFIWYYYSI